MKEELRETKESLNEIREQSFAMELLQYSKMQNNQLEKANKRIIVVLIIILVMWFATIGAFLYYINTVDYQETTEYAETDDGGNACVGDNCNNGEIKYGNSN